jgi:putative hydrolase of the HAD superfamily
VNVEVVVLDIDDTVFLESAYVRSGFRAVERHVEEVSGVEGFGDVAWREFEQGARGDVFDRALARLGLSQDLRVAELVDVYRSHAPDIRPLEDLTTMVRSLRSAGCRLGVVTDGPPASQRAKLRALELDIDEELVVVTGEHGPAAAKPARFAFEAIERTSGRQGGALAYVGDNPAKDFRAPHALGWRTVRVRRLGSLHHAVASGTDVGLEVPDLTGVADWLVGGGQACASE